MEQHSTNPSSAAKRGWLGLRKNKSRDASTNYVSCDGSSTGWYSTCVVLSDSDEVVLNARWGDMEGSRNVGAEAHGYCLGVQTLMDLKPAVNNTVVLCDFLNALAFDCGGANCKMPLLVKAYASLQSQRGKYETLTGAALKLQRVHHPGHQKDSSWFTKLNFIADHLSSLREDVFNVKVGIHEVDALSRDVESCRSVINKAREAAGIIEVDGESAPKKVKVL